MELTIKVEIGVTQELSSILSGVINMKEWKATAQTATAIQEKPKKDTAKTEVKEDPKTETAKTEVKEEPKTEKKAEAKASYTEEDIRNAMHECRMRIEGPDYKENTTSPGYTKHHKNLTQWFKNQAALLGSDKPSALPAEARKAFIDVCENTTVGDNGEFTL